MTHCCKRPIVRWQSLWKLRQIVRVLVSVASQNVHNNKQAALTFKLGSSKAVSESWVLARTIYWSHPWEIHCYVTKHADIPLNLSISSISPSIQSPGPFLTWFYSSYYALIASSKCTHLLVILAVMKQLKQPIKKSEASTGYESITSAIPVRCSTNWAMTPRWKQVRCEFGTP